MVYFKVYFYVWEKCLFIVSRVFFIILSLQNLFKSRPERVKLQIYLKWKVCVCVCVKCWDIIGYFSNGSYVVLSHYLSQFKLNFENCCKWKSCPQKSTQTLIQWPALLFAFNFIDNSQVGIQFKFSPRLDFTLRTSSLAEALKVDCLSLHRAWEPLEPDTLSVTVGTNAPDLLTGF